MREILNSIAAAILALFVGLLATLAIFVLFFTIHLGYTTGNWIPSCLLIGSCSIAWALDRVSKHP